jgi:hypothetical protein
MPKEKLYKVYNPTVSAYQSVNKETAKLFIEASEKLAAELKADEAGETE